MKINVRKAGPVSILDLEGKLAFGDGHEALRKQIQSLVDSGVRRVAINLSGITFLDSSGIGILVRSFTTLKQLDGNCILYSPTKDVLMLFRMVRLDTVLNLAEDEATALARI